MRRSIVTSIFVSIFIIGCTFFSAHPAWAVEAELPPKADLEAAIERIENFADFQKYYGFDATAPVTPSMPHFQEYEYLNSLLLKISDLIDNYDNADFTLRNAKSYRDAIPVVDRTIASLRYTFGLVYAENLAAQSAASPSAVPTTNTTLSTTSSQTTTPATPVTQIIATTSTPNTPAATDKNESENKASDTSAITTFESTDTKSANRDNIIEPVEIPNTGAGVSQTSSILFVVLVSLVAAVAATGIYFFYNHQAKRPASVAARKKRH